MNLAKGEKQKQKQKQHSLRAELEHNIRGRRNMRYTRRENRQHKPRRHKMNRILYRERTGRNLQRTPDRNPSYRSHGKSKAIGCSSRLSSLGKYVRQDTLRALHPGQRNQPGCDRLAEKNNENYMRGCSNALLFS